MNVYFIILRSNMVISFILLFYVQMMTDSISNKFVWPYMDWQNAKQNERMNENESNVIRIRLGLVYYKF
jgi:hypothetical protein